MENCGTILYTYPAYSFGGKHKGDPFSPGPGAGKYNNVGPMAGSGPVFGPNPPRPGPYPHGPVVMSGTSHLKPGLLSNERRGPAHSFGDRLPRRPASGPGPQDYRATPAWASTAKQNPQPSWGPPPKPRPLSAPRPIREDFQLRHKPKGPSFGLPYKPLKKDPVPGPNAYRPCTGGCSACDGYKGPSFGLRPPMMYGRATSSSPGPNAHQCGCSTLGAATKRRPVSSRSAWTNA